MKLSFLVDLKGIDLSFWFKDDDDDGTIDGNETKSSSDNKELALSWPLGRIWDKAKVAAQPAPTC